MAKQDKLTEKLLKKKNIDYYMNLPYNIIIRKDPYGGYFAKVEELEGCMTQGETYEEAFKNIREAMELWLEVALEDGDKIPEPVSDEKFSGKFVLRLPKSLHRKLAQNARKENEEKGTNAKPPLFTAR